MGKSPVGSMKLAEVFRAARSEGRGVLIVYVTGGYPNLEASAEVARVASEAGADVLEIGIPFSDPLADGPTIQATSQIALSAGTGVDDCLALIERLSRECDAPIVPMLYCNTLMARGVDRMVGRIASAGAAGLVVPDLPAEEAGPLRAACMREGLDLVHMVAPTTTFERIRMISALSSGFIYCVSLTGVTGARPSVQAGLEQLVRRIKSVSELPVAVGFGISTPDHVRRVCEIADGAIVGSAVLDILLGSDRRGRPSAGPRSGALSEIRDFVRNLRAATRRGSGARTSGFEG